MQCFFPAELVKSISTPTLIVNSAYDSWQVHYYYYYALLFLFPYKLNTSIYIDIEIDLYRTRMRSSEQP